MFKFIASFALQNRLLIHNKSTLKYFNKYQAGALRCMCSNTEYVQKEETPTKDTKFREIYRFGSIRYGYYLHRLKWFQTVAAGIALPTSSLLYLCGIIDDEIAFSILLSGVMMTASIYVNAHIFHKAIGFMYISEDGNTLKVSYLDFWGKRVDEEHSVDDVMMFSDTPSLPTDKLMRHVMFFSEKKKRLRLFMIRAKITDELTFTKVFGPFQ